MFIFMILYFWDIFLWEADKSFPVQKTTYSVFTQKKLCVESEITGLLEIYLQLL